MILQAINMREEVFRAIESSNTDDQARDAVAELLGAGEIRAHFVLNMQAKLWTLGHRSNLAGQIEQLRA